jgi:hypothetical protein
MGRMSLRSLAALVLIACFSFLGGCKNLTAPVAPPGALKPLTEKENVISNLVASYDRADIAGYEELLHPDYTFRMQERDVASGQDEFWTRDHDMHVTRNMFLAAKGQDKADPARNLDQLTLELGPGAWSPVDSIGGSPCGDCWMTTREYRLTLMFAGNRGGYVSNDLAQIIVVPVDEGGQRL